MEAYSKEEKQRFRQSIGRGRKVFHPKGKINVDWERVATVFFTTYELGLSPLNGIELEKSRPPERVLKKFRNENGRLLDSGNVGASELEELREDIVKELKQRVKEDSTGGLKEKLFQDAHTIYEKANQITRYLLHEKGIKLHERDALALAVISIRTGASMHALAKDKAFAKKMKDTLKENGLQITADDANKLLVLFSD